MSDVSSASQAWIDIDPNKDGSLNSEEFSEVFPDYDFEEYDTNQDGGVTLEEYQNNRPLSAEEQQIYNNQFVRNSVLNTLSTNVKSGFSDNSINSAFKDMGKY